MSKVKPLYWHVKTTLGHASITPIPRRLLENAWILGLGEEHENPLIISTFKEIIIQKCTSGELKWLGLEHFNINQQYLLDSWIKDEITWEKLKTEYNKGPEGFNLEVYKPILEAGKACNLKIIGLMPPRDKANILARTGKIPEDGPKPCLPIDPSFYKMYLETLSNLFPRAGPMARIPLERLALAQSYKDSIAACRAAVEKGPGIIIMGWAHIEVPGAVIDRLSLLLGVDTLIRALGLRSGHLGLLEASKASGHVHVIG